MSRIKEISSSPTMRQYAQGVAQQSIGFVADFLSPGVDVASMTGKYKMYTEKNRFRIPDTRRAFGGDATILAFSAEDQTYDCQPHALDYPIDNLERLESQDLEDALREGATAVAEVAGLAHEKSVIDAALAALGAGTDLTWNSSADPVDALDGYILNIIKAAAYGSVMNVGILFGAEAWKIFKNAAAVRGRFVVSSSAGGKGVGFAVPTLDTVAGLFSGNTESRVSYAVFDNAAEGLAASMSFVLASSIIVFARHPRPTRRDPSFMKTFRRAGQWMVPGSYTKQDGRGEVAKFDWSEDVKVTNAAAAVRLNVATA